jgi:hypothetical protein
LGGRLSAVHHEINAIKQGIMVVQNSALSKSGKATAAVHLNHAFLSTSACISVAGSLPQRPLVLGIPVAPLSITGAEHVSAPTEPETEDIRSELKKKEAYAK